MASNVFYLVLGDIGIFPSLQRCAQFIAGDGGSEIQLNLSSADFGGFQIKDG